MTTNQYRVTSASQVSPIDAGFGLVHADTIIATTDDVLTIEPAAILRVGKKQTAGNIRDLELSAGQYDATLGDKAVRLILVDPDRAVRRFGVRFGDLSYDRPVVTGKGTQASWDSLWKTADVPDVVVDFDGPYKFVFWRGMSYAPSWAMDNSMTSLFFAETLEPGRYRDCCEMMSDRQCRYSHVRVIHNSPARIVIHWRCALADSAYTICRNQWADELFYIYPDGVAVRNVTIHLDPDDPDVWQTCPQTGKKIPCSMINSAPGKRTFNDMEFISVNPAGKSSQDISPLDAMTLLDSDQFTKTFTWPKPDSPAGEKLPKLREYIFRMNYKYRPGVFVASKPDGLQVCLQGNTGAQFEAGALAQDDRWMAVDTLPVPFADHIHWPVTRGYGTTPLTDPATYEERPTHTFLGYANNAPVDVTERGGATWVWFCGMAPEEESELRTRVRSWSQPSAVEGAVYDVRQGAYRVLLQKNEPTITVGDEPVTHPTFLLENPQHIPLVALHDGQPVNPSMVSVGQEQTMESSHTIFTFHQTLPPGTTIQFKKEM